MVRVTLALIIGAGTIATLILVSAIAAGPVEKPPVYQEKTLYVCAMLNGRFECRPYEVIRQQWLERQKQESIGE